MKLTRSQADALVRIRDRGPEAWCERNRAGGAVSRMFDRLAERGFCTKAPHRITPEGRAALDKIGCGTEMWNDGTPTSVDYDNDCAP